MSVKVSICMILCTFLLLGCAPAKIIKTSPENSELRAFVSNSDKSKTRVEGHLQLWKGQPVVVTQVGIEKVNLDSNSLELVDVQIPEYKKSLAVTTDDRLMVQTSNGKNDWLYVEDGKNWTKVDLPAPCKRNYRYFDFTGDESRLYLVSDHELFVQEGKNWKTIEITKRFRDDNKAHPSLHDGKVMLRYSNGEWGGGLVEIDLVTQKQWLLVSGLPVRNFLFDKKNKLWIVQSLGHMGYSSNVVLTHQNNKTEAVSYVTARSDGSGEWQLDKVFNWQHGITSFDAILKDAFNNPILVTSTGIFRLANARWECYRKWPVIVPVDEACTVTDGEFCFFVQNCGLLLYDVEQDKFTIVKEKNNRQR